MSELLSKSEIRNITIINMDGHQCFVADIVHFAATEDNILTLKIYFDVDRGFIPLRIETFRENITDEPVLITQASDFRKMDENFYWPMKGRIKAWRIINGERVWQPGSESLTIVNDIEFNIEVPDHFFSYEYPVGTEIYDAFLGTGYILGSTEEMLSQIESFVQERHRDYNDPRNQATDTEKVNANKTDTQKSDSKSITGDPIILYTPIYSRWQFWGSMMGVLGVLSVIIITKRKLK